VEPPILSSHSIHRAVYRYKATQRIHTRIKRLRPPLSPICRQVCIDRDFHPLIIRSAMHSGQYYPTRLCSPVNNLPISCGSIVQHVDVVTDPILPDKGSFHPQGLCSTGEEGGRNNWPSDSFPCVSNSQVNGEASLRVSHPLYQLKAYI
jgi:hypothetical protein